KEATYAHYPKEAYIDSEHKSTPERNDRKVNVQKSYSKMKKKNQFDDTKLVCDSISPKVSLNDLESSPIYRAHPKKQIVGLMINVSWGTEHIPSILAIVKEKNVQATFFITGK